MLHFLSAKTIRTQQQYLTGMEGACTKGDFYISECIGKAMACGRAKCGP